jgi:hypothetical protein
VQVYVRPLCSYDHESPSHTGALTVVPCRVRSDSTRTKQTLVEMCSAEGSLSDTETHFLSRFAHTPHLVDAFLPSLQTTVRRSLLPV